MKPVRHRHRRMKSPSALACSWRRHTRFLEKNLAGKPDLASPEDQQDSDNSLCVKELENTQYPENTLPIYLYCLVVEAGFYSDVVVCLPVIPATWVQFPAGAAWLEYFTLQQWPLT